MTKKLLNLFCIAGILFLANCESETSPTPKADFDYSSNNNFLAPTTITFKNESTGAKEYTWDFGDGSPNSTNINPIHQYTNTGKYTVILIASNESKLDQVSREIEVMGLPTADFSFEATNNFEAPTTVSFTNSSINATSYLWDFGDGENSSNINPTHSYSTEGAYNVKLTAINSVGENFTNKTITIKGPIGQQFEKLTEESWILASAKLDDVVNNDFQDVTLNLGGTYNGENSSAVYTYQFTGTFPDLSPWPKSGTWRFGTIYTTQLVRLDDSQNILYSLVGDVLTINFTYTGEGFIGGRTKIVEGNWEFVFNK